MQQKHRFIRYFAIAIIICACLLGADLVISQKYIAVTSYVFKKPAIKNGFKIVHLTDLHNYQFGSKNQRLIKKAAKERPDVIFLTGDMLNVDEERTDILTKLIEQLALIAPVYASLGNHEEEYMQIAGNRELITQMEQAGAVVLDKQYLDIEIGGHVHGGQVRLPFVGGLYDPEEGYFPTYTKGMFECGNGTMVLSAGLGSSRGIPRVNNLPELVICDVCNQGYK